MPPRSITSFDMRHDNRIFWVKVTHDEDDGRKIDYHEICNCAFRLMDKIVRNVAGSTICDPFMGTGSTGVAAVKAGKAFVGIEQNPTHFETACQRIAAALQETSREGT